MAAVGEPTKLLPLRLGLTENSKKRNNVIKQLILNISIEVIGILQKYNGRV